MSVAGRPPEFNLSTMVGLAACANYPLESRKSGRFEFRLWRTWISMSLRKITDFFPNRP